MEHRDVHIVFICINLAHIFVIFRKALWRFGESVHVPMRVYIRARITVHNHRLEKNYPERVEIKKSY